MHAAGGGRLTNVQIAELAVRISSRDMEVIATKYLDVDWAAVENSKREHRGDMESFNHDMIRKWAFKTYGKNQVKV